MVAADAGDRSFDESFAQNLTMTPVAHRRIHLRTAPPTLVTLRSLQEEVIGSDLRRHQIAEIPLADQSNLLGGAQMQDMHLAPGLLDDIQKAASRAQRALDVAHIGMTTHLGTR